MLIRYLSFRFVFGLILELKYVYNTLVLNERTIFACFGYFENKLYMYKTISNSGQLLKKCKISGQRLGPMHPHGASNWCRGRAGIPHRLYGQQAPGFGISETYKGNLEEE